MSSDARKGETGKDTTSQEFGEKNFTTPEPPNDFSNMYSNIANNLVNIGLARIGRTTKHDNPYLTPVSEAARQNTELPFLRQIAMKYKGEGQRQLLSKHFMQFKEMTLFIIYSAILKNDIELHNIVKTELKERLSSNETILSGKRRNENWYMFSKSFYNAFTETNDMKYALNYSFWSVLANKYPELIKLDEIFSDMNMDYLFRIFKYSYKDIEDNAKTYGEKI